MSQHTPGPWSFGPADTDDPRFMIGPDIDTMNIVAMTAMGNDEANAHLIAAAPDLLASLGGLIARIDEDFIEGAFLPDTIDAARTAIARAEGRAK